VAVLTVRNLVKRFENSTVAVDDIDLDVADGEIVSLLGPSGCGKTTTLRCVAGLETPDSGLIVLGDLTVFERAGSAKRHVVVAPEHRGLSMVFQQYALWPHMTVFENVAFGLKARHASKSDVAAMTETALRRVRLWDQRRRNISQLSGGQQQRIALARAIAVQPKMILFDEPLSNLDAQLREAMRMEILELQQSIGFAALYVTHDQDEAFSMSSRIVIMNQGRVEQSGAPLEIWQRPRSPFAAEFIGGTNKVTGKLMLIAGGTDAGVYLHTDAGPKIRLGDHETAAGGGRAIAFLRLDSLRVSHVRPEGDANIWHLPIGAQTFHGSHAIVTVKFGSATLRCRCPAPLPGSVTNVYVQIAPAEVLCFPDRSDPADPSDGHVASADRLDARDETRG
jgi:ABC-type Fe3+/spermidine/putrescine transport system ATPase subunit